MADAEPPAKKQKVQHVIAASISDFCHANLEVVGPPPPSPPPSLLIEERLVWFRMVLKKLRFGQEASDEEKPGEDAFRLQL